MRAGYLAHGLSLQDPTEMMAERGINIDHSTVVSSMTDTKSGSDNLFNPTVAIYCINFATGACPESSSMKAGQSAWARAGIAAVRIAPVAARNLPSIRFPMDGRTGAGSRRFAIGESSADTRRSATGQSRPLAATLFTLETGPLHMTVGAGCADAQYVVVSHWPIVRRHPRRNRDRSAARGRARR